MTLDKDNRKKQASDAQRVRQARNRIAAVKYPWLLPLAIALAVIVLAGAIIAGIVTGHFFG